jgi:hypothetical protein
MVWNPPGHNPGVHVPGTTVPIPYAMGLIPPMAPPNQEDLKRHAEVQAHRASVRDGRAANLKAQIGATVDDERKLALTVALAITLTDDDQMIVGGAKLGNLHQLCPTYFDATWQWTYDVRCLIQYSPQPVAVWFAREASDQGLPFDGSFKWTATTKWGRTKDHSRSGWRVGPSTFSHGDRPPFPAWVFPDGSCALSAVPLRRPSFGDVNFSPESLNKMVTKLRLDQPIAEA